jgi:lysophospholipase L1-like esterase
MTPEKVLQNFQKLFNIIRTALPDTYIADISIKPSIHGWRYEDKIVASNKLLKAFLASQKNVGYIDVHTLMLTPEGKVDPTLLQPDGLHLNANGYKVWRDAVLPFIKD